MRNKEYERQFLDAIAREAKHTGAAERLYRQAVNDRLEHGARTYGDNAWFERGFEICAVEAADEGADQTGWGVGLVQVLNRDERNGLIDPNNAHRIRFLIVQGCAAGMTSWMAFQHCRSIYGEFAKGGIDRPNKTYPYSE
jgi:hypothetical protein